MILALMLILFIEVKVGIVLVEYRYASRFAGLVDRSILNTYVNIVDEIIDLLFE